MPTIAQNRELTAQRVLRNLMAGMKEDDAEPINYLFGVDGEGNSPQAFFEKLVHLCRFHSEEGGVCVCLYDKEGLAKPLHPFQLNEMDSDAMTIGFTYLHPITKKERRVKDMKITRFLTNHICPKMENDTVKLVAVQLKESLKPFTFFYAKNTEDFVPLFRLMRIGSLEDRDNECDERYIASCMDKPAAYYNRPRKTVKTPSKRRGIHNENENSLFLEDGDDYVHPVECYKGCEAENVVLGLIFRGEHSMASLEQRIKDDCAFDLFKEGWGRGLGRFKNDTLYVGKGYDRDYKDRGRVWRNHIDTIKTNNEWIERTQSPLAGVTIYPVINNDPRGHVVCAYIDPHNLILVEEGNEDGGVAKIADDNLFNAAQYNAEWQTGNLRVKDNDLTDVIAEYYEETERFFCTCCQESVSGEPACVASEHSSNSEICEVCYEEDFSEALYINDEQFESYGVFHFLETVYSDYHGEHLFADHAERIIINDGEDDCDSDYVLTNSNMHRNGVQLSDIVYDQDDREMRFADGRLVTRTVDGHAFLTIQQAHLYFVCHLSGECYSRLVTPFVVDQDGKYTAIPNLHRTYTVRGA